MTEPQRQVMEQNLNAKIKAIADKLKVSVGWLITGEAGMKAKGLDQ